MLFIFFLPGQPALERRQHLNRLDRQRSPSAIRSAAAIKCARGRIVIPLKSGAAGVIAL
jgi:hypothetical protein